MRARSPNSRSMRLILDGTVARVRLDEKGDLDLVADRTRRARHWPRRCCWRSRAWAEKAKAAWRALLRDDPRPAWIADAGAGRRRRRAGSRKGARGAVARHGCPALHRAQASQSPRPCARAPARGNLERLPRHDLRRDARRGRDPGARRSSANGGSRAASSPTAWRKPATSCSTFTRFPPSQWKSIRTSNAIERLHEEFKRRIKTQTVLPCADTAAMLFWALLASGQIIMRKVDGWHTLAEKPDDQIIDLAA